MKEVFYNEGAETLAQAAQRAGGCPIPGHSRSGWTGLGLVRHGVLSAQGIFPITGTTPTYIYIR